jgi:hypothetical protein
MPYRTHDVLQSWLDEFKAAGHELLGHVALQDGSDGRDTGLVIVRLENATTQMFMQPVAPGDQRWEITLEARHNDMIATADQLEQLSEELRRAAELCRFLQEKSAQHDREVEQAQQ